MDEKIIASEYDTDSPRTKEQAEELLKEYYKSHRNEVNFPRRPNLMSWKLLRNGTMIVVDGASGRELTFVVDESVQEKAAELESAEDAEIALLDAEAEAREAEAKAEAARVKAEQIKAQNKADKKFKAAEAVKDRKDKDKLAST